MNNNQYIQGKSYLLPVKEVISENKKVYYVVIAAGREYALPLYDFQKEDDRPEKISCLVKEVRNGQPVFVQDTLPLIARLYKEGETYSFWVKADLTLQPGGYYEVADRYGFVFRIPSNGSERLQNHQRVECKVRSAKEGRITLGLEKEVPKIRVIPFVRLEELLTALRVDERLQAWLVKSFQRSRLLKATREAYTIGNNGEWVFTAIKELDESMEQWAAYRKRGNLLLLELFSRTCIYLLEDSDTLTYCDTEERRRYQELISEAVHHATVFQEATKMVRNNQHWRQTDLLLEKLSKSGFLYDPDRRLKVLMCIFSLDKQVMESKLQAIFEVILTGDKKNWLQEPFRSAFIGMLDLFVQQNRNRIDRLADTETEENKQDLKKLIAALAIQLLMMTEKDNYDRQLNRAMLYRYLTYVKGCKEEVLYEKAFRCLTDAEQSAMEFNWGEVSELTLLAIKASSVMPTDKGLHRSIAQSYVGSYARLQIVDGNIEIRPLGTQGKQVPVLPNGLLPWHNIQIYQKSPVSPISAEESDLTRLQRFWHEVELGVMNETTTAPIMPKNRKMRPEEGDEVTIRIKCQDPEEPDHFIFEIDDPNYFGEGRLTARNIVKYGLELDESAFKDEKNRPLLLKARVLSTDNLGGLNFIITELMNEFVRDCISINDETLCLVTDIYFNNYLCVSENGYSLIVPRTDEEDEIAPGSYIVAEIANIRTNGTVEGAFVRHSTTGFSRREAFENLIYSYAEGKAYEPVQETVGQEQPEVMMDEEYVKELIHIIDRTAVTNTNYVVTYNYLAFARILSLLAMDKTNAVYFRNRMDLLRMLQFFAVNGQVDQDKLWNLVQNGGIIINNYPLLQSKLMELQTIACMDDEEKSPQIWKRMTETDNEHLFRLCRLVLSYNHLKGFGLHTEREAIRKKINEELNLPYIESEAAYFGMEDLHREFKTSIVYPADNGMQPNLEVQTHEILQVICGFLNAEGGTLFLGVNNEGVAAGIDNDIDYLGGKDKLDLYIRNAIAHKLGLYANGRIRVIHPDAGGKYIYGLKIEPSPYPIELDGICYQRQGSSTWPLLGDNLELFRSRRQQEVEKLSFPNAVSDTHAIRNEFQPETDSEGSPEKQTPATVKSAKAPNVVTEIATSVIRENPIHNWEDNYGVDTRCYLHFMPGSEYMITHDECWEETELSLRIGYEDEYIVVVYESGNTLRIPVTQIIDKKEHAKYKRAKETVVFACPARKDEMLLTEVKDLNGRNIFRLDDILNLREGVFSDRGEQLSTVEHGEVVRCDVLPLQHKEHLRKIHNMRITQLGNCLESNWGQDMHNYLKKLLQF